MDYIVINISLIIVLIISLIRKDDALATAASLGAIIYNLIFWIPKWRILLEIAQKVC